MESEPVLSVWPTMRTSVFTLARRPSAKRSSTGAKLPLMSERPVSNEMSLGMSSLSWLSAVCVTPMPVPWVAASISRFCFSMFCDQM
ncbi:hypothetical protein D3C78_1770260 [compost metagenome]